ncbi:isoprenylcysteine carboxylmethyltransferase family protein [Candidatus Saccharibacteria bacterium]|nr:isoprenylcysteine carboxylmethyltransferase family protein [Candidatus Saccharibacteria bacterium]
MVLIFAFYARPSSVSFGWGILLMVLGESLRIWSVAYAGHKTRSRTLEAEKLIIWGPFARTRNPLYLANMFIYTGATVISNIWLPYFVFVVWIYFGIQYSIIIRMEEAFLAGLFGESYLAYKRRVPRVIPSPSPKVHCHTQNPDYKASFISEKSTFISIMGILLLFGIRAYFI